MSAVKWDFLWIFILDGLTNFIHIHPQLTFSVYKLECVNATKYVKNGNCFLKAISRGVKALSSTYDIVEQINSMILNIVISYRVSTNAFQTTILNVSADLCGATGQMPIFIQFIVPLLNKYAPGFLHDCPYKPEKGFGVKNFMIDQSLLPLLTIANVQAGEYCTTAKAVDKKHDVIFLIKIYSIVERPSLKKKSKKGTATELVSF